MYLHSLKMMLYDFFRKSVQHSSTDRGAIPTRSPNIFAGHRKDGLQNYHQAFAALSEKRFDRCFSGINCSESSASIRIRSNLLGGWIGLRESDPA
jgi:hypothetical protein